MRRRLLLTLTMLIAFGICPSLLEAQVLLNEVLFHPSTEDPPLPPPDFFDDHEWIELYNSSIDTVDISGWWLTGGSGIPFVVFSDSFYFPPDAHLMVHFSTGISDTGFVAGLRSVYAGVSDVLPDSTGEAALYTGTPSPGTIADFVSWSYTGYGGSTAHSHAVSGGIWPGGDFLLLEYETEAGENVISQFDGSTIGRDSLSTNTNSSTDWQILGGRDAFHQTPEGPNTEKDGGTQLSAGPHHREKKATTDWLIMVYMDTRDAGTSDTKGILACSYREIAMMEEYFPANMRNYEIVVQVSHRAKKTTEGARYYVESHNSKGIASSFDALTGQNRDAWRPENLTTFIQAAMNEHDANNHALILAGHGGGWKGVLAMTQDTLNLNMSELRTAIDNALPQGEKLDVLVFENCRMGMAEVIYQVGDLADYVIASEKTRKLFANWTSFLKALHNSNLTGSSWSPIEFGKGMIAKDGQKSIALFNMARVEELAGKVSDFADVLKRLVDETKEHRDRDDNLQVEIRNARDDAFMLGDRTFIDLHSFADEIEDNDALADAHESAAAVKALLATVGDDSLIVARRHKNSKDLGLSIYFPRRMSEWRGSGKNAEGPLDEPRRLEWMDPQPYRYAENENCTPGDSPETHPRPVIPDFRWADSTEWDGFLERYFEPAPEAVIVYKGKTYKTLWLRARGGVINFELSTEGSSDIDQRDDELQPEEFYWDLIPGINSDMKDRDYDCDSSETDDDEDAEGETKAMSIPGAASGVYKFVISVLDDHHTGSDTLHQKHFQSRQDECFLIILPPFPCFPTTVAINEAMILPEALTDSLGEWVELVNLGDSPVDLEGWLITDGITDSHFVSSGGPLVIAPGEHAVVARNAAALAAEGVTALYEYGNSLHLDETDQLFLVDPGDTLRDGVAWGASNGSPSVPGASIQWNGNCDRFDGTNWIIGTTPFGSGDIGTPGAPNEEPPVGWIDHVAGNVVCTFTDHGVIGFTDDTQLSGSGFVYPSGGSNLLFIGGLWVGLDSAYVVGRDYAVDPEARWRVVATPPGTIQSVPAGPSDEGTSAVFHDGDGFLPQGMQIEQETWGFTDATNDDYVILNYTFQNISDSLISGSMAGIFLDIDIGTYDTNLAGTDTTRGLAWMTGDTGEYMGVRLLGPGAGPAMLANLAVIDNATYVYPTQWVPTADKWGFLAGSAPEYTGPDGTAPADYSVIASAGPIDVAPGESRLISFALVGGSTLGELIANSDAAQQTYVQVATDVPAADHQVPTRLAIRNSPNPFNPSTAIRFALPESGMVRLDIFDLSGRLIRSLVDRQMPAGSHAVSWDGKNSGGAEMASGVYFYRLDAGGGVVSRKMVLIR